MAPQQRKLAAIVVADVAAYSRLIGADEEGTLTALRAVRRTIVDPAIEAFHGRLVKTMGDGLLVEFASVVDAMRCVVQWQSAMDAHGADTPEDRRIVFRIGVNLGDVVVEEGDIFGDGINVAARLQAIAPAGGASVSGRVHDEVRDRLDIAFEDAGEQTLRNIARPVRVWRWSPGAAPAPRQSVEAPVEVSEVVRALGRKPTVAVLPFLNLSGDPAQDYFTDGVTEDIITALSRFRELLVSPRSSSFPLKGTSLAVRDVARQLGVQYVLGGSMRKAQNRIRVTAELCGGESGVQVWADRYDRDLLDIFELQDELSRTVAVVVHPAVRNAEVEQARRKRPEDLTAYDLYLRALPHMWANTRHDLPKAIELLRRSVERDATSAPALAGLSLCLFMAAPAGIASTAETFPESLALARRAVEQDDTDSFAQAVYARALGAIADDHEQGRLHAQEALRLNPSSAFAWGCMGSACSMAGDFDGAVESLGSAIRLGPADSFLYFWQTWLAAAYFALQRYDDAVATARQAVQRNPNFGTAHRLLAAGLALAGRTDEAREVTRRRDAVQTTTIGELRALRLFRQPEILERYLAAQRLCGVPE